MASWSLDAVGLEPALVTLGAKGERLNEVWPSSDGAADYGSEGREFKSRHLDLKAINAYLYQVR